MQQLYIIRHGQSTSNAHKVVAGSLDAPLSELGVLQSKLAGQNAKEYFSFDLIVTSPMVRATQTAAIIAQEIGLSDDKIIQLEPLRERNLGSLEGVDYAHAPQYNGNYEDAEGAPGIEPLEALLERAANAVTTLESYPAKQILIVCHNGIGRMLKVAIKQGQPADMYKQPRLENAAIYKLR